MNKTFNKFIYKFSYKNKIKIIYRFNCVYKFRLILILFIAFIYISYILQYSNDKVFENNYIINNNMIKIGYYCNSIKNGGVERVMAQLIKYLSIEKTFIHYLICVEGILEGEYPIPNSTIRINLKFRRLSLFNAIKRNNIDILIYNFYDRSEIKKLNKLDKTKVIFYNHSTYFYWIYLHVYNFKYSVYSDYKKCNYIISLIPVENDYLFKKWGINSILMDNPSTIEYNSVTPSELKQKNIIMVGRAKDHIKRYDLGIKAMQTIIKEITICEMNIVSVPLDKYERLIRELNLSNYVRFVGYQKDVEIYFKNSSLHIMPSLAESYSMALGEAKIFGVPSIICGLDYLLLAKGGTIIIYDDNPDTIAKEAIKILKDDKYRLKLGKEARQSMKKHNNTLIMKKWIELLMAVYKGDIDTYRNISDKTYKIKDDEREHILNNQYQLFVRREPNFRNLTFQNFIDYCF